MRLHLVGCSLLAAVTLGIATSAEGSITLTPIPAGSVSVVFEGAATFERQRNSTITGLPSLSPTSLEATLIQKTFGPGVTSISFSVSYGTADFDSTGLFRWAERVTNNTGSPLTSITMTLSGTSAVFGGNVNGFGQPTFMTINNNSPTGFNAAPGNLLLSDDFNNPVGLDTIGTATLSAGNKVATFTLNTPLAPGASVGVYNAIQGFTPNVGGSFQITENITVTPEAESVMVWGLLGLSVCGGVWMQRRNVRA